MDELKDNTRIEIERIMALANVLMTMLKIGKLNLSEEDKIDIELNRHDVCVLFSDLLDHCSNALAILEKEG